MRNPIEARRAARSSLALEVQYHSQGSFLLSYSRNLSKGGLFLETNELLPEGTKLAVKFKVPGIKDTVETMAQVMWVRRADSEAGLPNGLGLQFEQLEEHIGEVIDQLVQTFNGLRLTAVAGDQNTLERLGSYLHSILTCEVHTVLAADFLVTYMDAAKRSDLLLVDLDSTGAEGIKVIQAARSAHELAQPVIALSRQADLKTQALNIGAQEAIDNPPSYELLRQRVLDLLEKPLRSG